MYNKGACRYIPLWKIVLVRNKERARQKQLLEIRALENPDEEFDIDQHLPVVTEAEYMANPSAYREVCWDLKVTTLKWYKAEAGSFLRSFHYCYFAIHRNVGLLVNQFYIYAY